jgi:hypothetical protein
MDDHQLYSWLIALALLIALPLLVTSRAARRRLVDLRLTPWGRRLVDHLTPTPEVDVLAADLARVLRKEQLLVHLARLRRLLLTDMNMSATRQLGNRLAYEWLQRELTRLGDVPSFPGRAIPSSRFSSSSPHRSGWSGEDPLSDWDYTEGDPAAPTPEPTAAPLGYSPRPRQVEILEIGRRSRAR